MRYGTGWPAFLFRVFSVWIIFGQDLGPAKAAVLSVDPNTHPPPFSNPANGSKKIWNGPRALIWFLSGSQIKHVRFWNDMQFSTDWKFILNFKCICLWTQHRWITRSMPHISGIYKYVRNIQVMFLPWLKKGSWSPICIRKYPQSELKK